MRLEARVGYGFASNPPCALKGVWKKTSETREG